MSILKNVDLSELRKLLGYIENGSDVVVRFFQDAATKEFIVKVGNRTYFSRSFPDAVAKAMDDIEEL